MGRALLMFTIASLLSACADTQPPDPAAPLGSAALGVSCDPFLERYPVAGPHNGGYDSNALNYTCPPHPGGSPDNSDWIGGDHYGNDIFAAKGTPIVAPRAGQVVKSGYSGVSGLRVTLRDACGWHYFHAHLDTIAPGIGVGANVAAGDLLGTVGNTGNASGTSPHLHFSIYPDSYNSGIDPFPYLQAVDATACSGGCTPHCEGSVIVDAGCAHGDCGAFGLTCVMSGGKPECAETGCTPQCQGSVIVNGDCSTGDCAAFGASCTMQGGSPTCVAPTCSPHCEGSVMVGADCSTGDCGAFGASCVMQGGEPTCVLACTPHCDGTVGVQADCSTGDCGAFGASCVMKNGVPECELSCTPHCEGSIIVDAACGQGDCGAFGMTCVMNGATPECAASGCTPHCEGSVMVGADCSSGDCGAFGADCVMEGGAPTCELPCTPHCEGTLIVDAACGVGDCAAFGSTCQLVDQGGAVVPDCVLGCQPHCEGAFIVDAACEKGDCAAFGLDCVVNEVGVPECGTPACGHHCDGTQIVYSDCTVGDCGAFGLTCGDFGVGPHCTLAACEPHCEGDIVVDSSCAKGDCSVFGAFCSTAGGTPPHCAFAACVDSPEEIPQPHDICLDGVRYHCDETGGVEEKPCPAGQPCNACGGCGAAPTEACNGVDDDCDGQIDEEVKNACGQCGAAPTEICDYLDNDCDGQVDEGVKNACGTCEVVFPAEVCDYLDNDCDGQTDEGVQNACGQCGDAPSEVCDYLDNDCDGAIDEDFEGLGEACAQGEGLCSVKGSVACAVGGQGTACTAVARDAATDEVCNALDDDCDGETDEGLELGQPCQVGDGACAVAGTWACAGDASGDVVCATSGTHACDDQDPCTHDTCDLAGSCNNELVEDCCVLTGCGAGAACVVGVCVDALCAPCAVDADCGGGGAICVIYPAGNACATTCGDAADCPEGFECVALEADGDGRATAPLCLAEAGACDPAGGGGDDTGDDPDATDGGAGDPGTDADAPTPDAVQDVGPTDDASAPSEDASTDDTGSPSEDVSTDDTGSPSGDASTGGGGGETGSTGDEPGTGDPDDPDDDTSSAPSSGGCASGGGHSEPALPWLLGLLLLAAASHQLRAKRREAPAASPWRGPEAVEVVLAVRRDCRREHAVKTLVDPKLQPNGGEKLRLALAASRARPALAAAVLGSMLGGACDAPPAVTGDLVPEPQDAETWLEPTAAALPSCDASACGETPAVANATLTVQFTDVTADVGIEWTAHAPAELPAGGGFVDLDGDGFDDVVLTTYSPAPGATGAPRLAVYMNQGDGTFEDRTIEMGLLALQLPLTGVAASDFDADGDQDLYLTSWGSNVLLRNDGEAGLAPVTAAAGADDPSWSTAAAFGDYDRDGYPDLYVGNYIAESDFPAHIGFPNRLLHNEGDGTFTDVTESLGVGGAGTTFAVTWADLDDDGDPDLLVCNDHGVFVERNQVYRNDGPGADGGWAFSEVAAAWGLAADIYCMGVAVGDVDGDAAMDVYLTNLGANVLLRRGPDGMFEDVAEATGATVSHDTCASGAPISSWGVGLHDFDLDGDLDAHLSGGSLLAAPELANSASATSTLLLQVAPGPVFADVGACAGLWRPGALGRGTAYADYDQDGDVDILQLHVEGPAVLLRNDSERAGHWLGLRLRGQQSPTDGLGARVSAVLADGRLVVREVAPQGSYGSTSSPAVHLGLGESTAVTVTIEWPSGMTQVLEDVAGDQRLEVIEPTP